MSSLTDLTSVSYDDIETKVMSVLYSNIDVNFTQFALYNKVFEKFDVLPTSFSGGQSFKAKFLIVLRNLMSKYDDIKISKNGDIYSIICLSNKDAAEIPTKTYNDVNPASITFPNISDYIIENNWEKEFDYIDPFDGNTIFHDLVISGNYNKIKKLIEQKKFNFNAKNKLNLTPIDVSQEIRISILMLSKLCENIMNENIHLKIQIEDLTLKTNDIENQTNKLIKNRNKSYTKIYIFIILIIAIFIKYYFD